MTELYNLFWSAIKGESLDEFISFIEEIRGSNTLRERLLMYSPRNKSTDLSLLVRTTPIQFRFLAFLEELVSALIIELLSLEPYLPGECDNLSKFIQDRVRVMIDLTRDLKQETREYNLSWKETWKAESLSKSYLLMGNEMLKACKSNN
jgi:hypothetical protein